MRHVVIASHNKFARGLADTLDFLGNKTALNVICAYVDETPLVPQVDELFSAFSPDDEVLILTDILQGSVNQAFAPYINDHVFLVAGVNVALSLELCLSAEGLTVEGIEEAIEMGRQSMRLINTLQIEDGEDDE
jgi:PTS system mannose-specific IIA component